MPAIRLRPKTGEEFGADLSYEQLREAADSTHPDRQGMGDFEARPAAPVAGGLNAGGQDALAIGRLRCRRRTVDPDERDTRLSVKAVADADAQGRSDLRGATQAGLQPISTRRGAATGEGIGQRGEAAKGADSGDKLQACGESSAPAWSCGIGLQLLSGRPSSSRGGTQNVLTGADVVNRAL